jgi:hypothetical protein
MAVTTAFRLAHDFDAQIQELLKIAAGPSGDNKAPRDVRERLLEAIFLNAVTATEAFLERLFFIAVTGSLRTGGVRAVVRFPTEEIAWQMVLPPRSTYLTWLPYRDASDRARAFLDEGLPFTLLDERSQLKSRLDEAMVVRNMVAHRSEPVQRRFTSLVGSRFSTAGEYLAAISGEDRICEAFLQDFVRIANGLCARDDGEMVTILGDPDLLPSGRKVDAGGYECSGCGRVITVGIGMTALLKCATCDPPCISCGKSGNTALFRKQ